MRNCVTSRSGLLYLNGNMTHPFKNSGPPPHRPGTKSLHRRSFVNGNLLDKEGINVHPLFLTCIGDG